MPLSRRRAARRTRASAIGRTNYRRRSSHEADQPHSGIPARESILYSNPPGWTMALWTSRAPDALSWIGNNCDAGYTPGHAPTRNARATPAASAAGDRPRALRLPQRAPSSPQDLRQRARAHDGRGGGQGRPLPGHRSATVAGEDHADGGSGGGQQHRHRATGPGRMAPPLAGGAALSVRARGLRPGGEAHLPSLSHRTSWACGRGDTWWASATSEITDIETAPEGLEALLPGFLARLLASAIAG